MSDHPSDPSAAASRQISAITLFVVDVAESKRFYETAFDTKPVFETDDSVVFQFAGTFVNLLSTESVPELVEPARAAPREAGVRAVLTIDVADVDAAAAALQAQGITLLNGPMDRPWGPRTASFRDPDGHVWEFAKP